MCGLAALERSEKMIHLHFLYPVQIESEEEFLKIEEEASLIYREHGALGYSVSAINERTFGKRSNGFVFLNLG